MRQAFEVHLVNDDGKRKANLIAESFNQLVDELRVVIYRSDLARHAAGTDLTAAPVGGREFAIVMTKLEEACFFAKKAMALQPENQLPKEPAKWPSHDK